MAKSHEIPMNHVPLLSSRLRLVVLAFLILLNVISLALLSAGQTNQSAAFLAALGLSAIAWATVWMALGVQLKASRQSQQQIQDLQSQLDETAILSSEAHSRVAQLSSLNRISTVLSLAPSLEDIFDGARREIMSLIEATGMSILLLTPEQDRLNWIYGHEYGQEVDLSTIPPLPISEGFSGQVARTRQVLYISQHADKLRQQVHSRVVGARANTWLGLPMIVANRLIGVLAVENESGFSDREIELLKTITGPLAIAINNLIQFEEIQAALEAQSRQRVQLQTAAEVAAAATSVLELDELVQRSVDLIKERFDLYYVGLFLVDAAANQAVLRAATGEAGRVQLEAKHRLPVGGRSLIGGATTDGAARITQDVTLDEEWFPNPHLPETRSELALPLRVRGHLIGALTVQSNKANVFTPELISALQTMSDQLAVAIQNAQLLAHAEARIESQQALNQISARLHRTADVDQIIAIGLRALSEQMAGAGVSLTLGRQKME